MRRGAEKEGGCEVGVGDVPKPDLLVTLAFEDSNPLIRFFIELYFQIFSINSFLLYFKFF